jgi:hypothetical protein
LIEIGLASSRLARCCRWPPDSNQSVVGLPHATFAVLTHQPPPLYQVLRLLGNNPTLGEFDTVLKSIDRNNDGVVDFREFAHVRRSTALELPCLSLMLSPGW